VSLIKDLDFKIAKLPKWAQEYIDDINREREVILKTLNKHVEEQEESPFYVDYTVCSGEKPGPTDKRMYINTNKLTVSFEGVTLDITLRESIDLQWYSEDRHIEPVAMMPTSFNAISLVNKRYMR
jgi:hypothetical protein